jgi:hypothetical protein
MRRIALTVLGTLLTELIAAALLVAAMYWWPMFSVSSSGGRDGKSMETALLVNAATEFEGVYAETAWLEFHYPRHTLELQQLEFSGDHPYDVMSLRAPDGTLSTIYFDIDSFYGIWETGGTE